MTTVSPFVRGYAVFVLIWIFLVIIAGGVVRTTQSGMGCPDWPKCFGSWIPPVSADQLPPDFEKYLRKQDIDHTFNPYHTWVEYINRLLGALLGLIAVIQVVLALPYRRVRPKIFLFSVFFLVTVIATGLLGAIVVKLNLAHFSISAHLTLAFLLLQIQVLVLLAIRQKEKIAVNKTLRRWLLFFLVAIIIQSAMGTAVRMYVDDVSKSLAYLQREKWLQQLPVVILGHRTFSWTLLALLLYGIVNYRKTPVKNGLGWLGFITVLNIVTGVVLFYANMPAFAQPVHVTLAAAIITQCCYLLFRTKTISAR